MRTQIKEDGVWVDGTPAIGEWYRQQVASFPNGDPVWQEQRFVEVIPEPVINITMTGDKTVMTLGDTLNFTVSFDDKTFNGHVTISVTDRDGLQVDNIGIEMVNGECSNGTYTPVKSLDYFVTNEGINFYNTGVKYVMADEFNIRVESA